MCKVPRRNHDLGCRCLRGARAAAVVVVAPKGGLRQGACGQRCGLLADGTHERVGAERIEVGAAEAKRAALGKRGQRHVGRQQKLARERTEDL